MKVNFSFIIFWVIFLMCLECLVVWRWGCLVSSWWYIFIMNLMCRVLFWMD